LYKPYNTNFSCSDGNIRGVSEEELRTKSAHASKRALSESIAILDSEVEAEEDICVVEKERAAAVKKREEAERTGQERRRESFVWGCVVWRGNVGSQSFHFTLTL
jgi:hypothetical protein